MADKKDSRTIIVKGKDKETFVFSLKEGDPQESSFAQANDLRSKKQYDEALKILNGILTKDLKNSSALHLKCLIHWEKKEGPKALKAIEGVAKLESKDWEVYNSHGILCRDTEKTEEAVNEFKVALKHAPNQYHQLIKENLAIALTDHATKIKNKGDWTTAVKLYFECIKTYPYYGPPYYHLGTVCGEIDNQVQALEFYFLCLRCNPNHPEALGNIGVIYKNAGKLEVAIDYYKKALFSNPQFPLCNKNMAIAFTDLGTKVKIAGDMHMGINYYKKALLYYVQYAPAWYNLGVAYAESGRHDQAVTCYEMCVAFDDKCAEAYNNMGVIYKDNRGNSDKAVYFYQKALQANPQYAQALNNLGGIETAQGKFDEAFEHCKEAVRISPKYAEAYNNCGMICRDKGEVVEAIKYYDECLAIDPLSRNAGQNRLFAMNSLYPTTPKETDQQVIDKIYREHVKWGALFSEQYRPFKDWDNKLTTDRPVRVGYISGDFFTHSVSYFIEAPLSHANSKKVFNVCYSNMLKGDGRTEQFKRWAHKWRPVHGLSNDQIAALVREDQIDIFIELAGHTAGNRLDVMALKPAPIQITWIGYPNTTGLTAIDYRITDGVVDPVDTKQKFVEELIRLPGTFLCYTHPADSPPITIPPCASNPFITFGSFNNLAKINSKVIAAWSAILNQVKDSKMVLKAKPFTSEKVRNHYLEQFEQHGVERKRVELLLLAPSNREHMSIYNLVDLSLDTYPYAGTTTTCEALEMGVPVVTLTTKNNHAHNVGGTLISRVKCLQEYVCTTEQEYIAKAVELAKNRKKLLQIRQQVRDDFRASIVCDGKTFTAGLEDVYQDLWNRYVTKRKAQLAARAKS